MLVLDMSGSMEPIRDATVEGFNEYLRGLKEDKTGETLGTLVVFDTVFEMWHVAEPIDQIGYLDGRYQPRGMTALHDAIAHSIIETDRKLKELGREDMKVLHVTVTDGLENSSQEYRGFDGRDRLAKLVKRYEKKGNWTFVYLGSDHASLEDAQIHASGIGYVPENAMVYATANISGTMSNVSKATSTLRSAPSASSDTFFASAGLSAVDFTQNSGSADPNPKKKWGK